MGLREGSVPSAGASNFSSRSSVTLHLALLDVCGRLNLSLYEMAAGASRNLRQDLTRRSGALGSFFTFASSRSSWRPHAPAPSSVRRWASPERNAVAALAIFLALGAGFAAPFVALGFIPGVLKLLPRPGAWMTMLRRGLAFPMYGAAIWLVWVLSFEAGSDFASSRPWRLRSCWPCALSCVWR